MTGDTYTEAELAEAEARVAKAQRRRRVRVAAGKAWPHLFQLAGVGLVMLGVYQLFGAGWAWLAAGVVLVAVGALREGGLI